MISRLVVVMHVLGRGPHFLVFPYPACWPIFCIAGAWGGSHTVCRCAMLSFHLGAFTTLLQH